jgi:hypothetical protein
LDRGSPDSTHRQILAGNRRKWGIKAMDPA